MSNSASKYEELLAENKISALDKEYEMAAREIKFQTNFIFDETFDIEQFQKALDKLKEIQTKIRKHGL